MALDLTLAILHHIFVFGLFSVLVTEMVLVRPGLDASTLARVGRLDGVYGGLALAVLVVGFMRALWGLKGWEYYSTNPYFWIKIALFLVIGILSVRPTLRFLAWRRQAPGDGWAPPADELSGVRRLIHIQLGLLMLIPVVAAVMARY